MKTHFKHFLFCDRNPLELNQKLTDLEKTKKTHALITRLHMFLYP